MQIQQCTSPELTGKDLKNKSKEISLTRSVSMCGWRTAEIKTLPEEIFDLFATLFKRIEESQIWPEILLQVVTTFIPKVDDEDLDKVNQKKLACPAPEEMRPINNASPWYSIFTSLRYEQMESWRNEIMPSSMHGARKDHGVWDVSLEHMLEMEAAVEKDQCLGALSLDWSKFFDSLERDTGNSLVQYMLGRDSNALGYVQAERTFTELSKARVKVGRAVQTQGKTRGNGFLQGPCYSIEVALMMMSVWTRAVETEADVQTTGFVDDSAVRSKRGKTRDQVMTNLRQAWEVSKEFGSKAGTKCNRKKVKMIASDEKTEKEMEKELEEEELKCTKAFVLVGGTMTTCTTSSKKKQAQIRERRMEKYEGVEKVQTDSRRL